MTDPRNQGWKNLEVCGIPEGFKAGVIEDDYGLIMIALRPPDGDWPNRLTPIASTVKAIGVSGLYVARWRDHGPESA